MYFLYISRIQILYYFFYYPLLSIKNRENFLSIQSLSSEELTMHIQGKTSIKFTGANLPINFQIGLGNQDHRPCYIHFKYTASDFLGSQRSTTFIVSIIVNNMVLPPKVN